MDEDLATGNGVIVRHDPDFIVLMGVSSILAVLAAKTIFSPVEAMAKVVAATRRGANPRLKTKDTLVAVHEVGEGGSARLLNLSTTGACVTLENPVEKGQSLELKLAHPKLSVVPVLLGQVMWFQETDDKRTRVGLQFSDSLTL